MDATRYPEDGEEVLLERMRDPLNPQNLAMFQDMNDHAWVWNLESLHKAEIPLHPYYIARFVNYAYHILAIEVERCREEKTPSRGTRSMETKAYYFRVCAQKLSAYITLMWPELGRAYDSGPAKRLSLGLCLFYCMCMALVGYYHSTRGRIGCSDEADTAFKFARETGICIHNINIMSFNMTQCLKSWRQLATVISKVDPSDERVRKFRLLLLTRTAMLLHAKMDDNSPTIKVHEKIIEGLGVRVASDIMGQEILNCWVDVEGRIMAWVYCISPHIVAPTLHVIGERDFLVQKHFGEAYTFSDIYNGVTARVLEIMSRSTNETLLDMVTDRIRANFVPSWFPGTLTYYGHITARDDVIQLEKHWRYPSAINIDLGSYSLEQLVHGEDFQPFFGDVSIYACGYICEQVMLQQAGNAVHWFELCFLDDLDAMKATVPCNSSEIEDGVPFYTPALEPEDKFATFKWEEETPGVLPTGWYMALAEKDGGSTPTILRVQDRLLLYKGEKFHEILRDTWLECFVDALCFWMLCVLDSDVEVLINDVEYDFHWLQDMMLSLMKKGGSQLDNALNLPLSCVTI